MLGTLECGKWFNNSVLSPCVRKDNGKDLVQTVPMLQLSPWSSRTNLWFNLENVNVNSVLFSSASGYVSFCRNTHNVL